MALEEHSFRHLLPRFLISPGTQVVLKADKALPGSERVPGPLALRGNRLMRLLPVGDGCIEPSSLWRFFFV